MTIAQIGESCVKCKKPWTETWTYKETDAMCEPCRQATVTAEELDVVRDIAVRLKDGQRYRAAFELQDYVTSQLSHNSMMKRLTIQLQNNPNQEKQT